MANNDKHEAADVDAINDDTEVDHLVVVDYREGRLRNPPEVPLRRQVAGGWRCRIKRNMMHFFMKKQHTIGYNSIPDLPPTTTTMGHRSKWMMTTVRSLGIIVVAGMMLVAGGAVLMQDGLYYHSSGSLETEDGGMEGEEDELLLLEDNDNDNDNDALCLPATDTFNGISFHTIWRQKYPFESCFQLGDKATYCWSKSYHVYGWDRYSECCPNGHDWNAIDAYFVNPVTTPNSCGTPCQHMHQC